MKRCQKIWVGPSPPHLDKIQNSSFFLVPFPYKGAKTASRVEGGFVLGINYPYKRGWSKLRSNRRSVFWSICNMVICEICKYLRLITINVLGWPVEGLSSPLLTNIRPRTAKHPFLAPQVVVVPGLGDPIQILQHKAPKIVLTAR